MMAAQVDGYFSDYDNLEVHRIMLQDAPRVNAYREAIETNVSRIRDCIVLDVGAGTGILSLFAAKAGAKRVFAVEAAPGLQEVIRELAEKNHLESVIVIIPSILEDIKDLNDLWSFPTIAESMGEKNKINSDEIVTSVQPVDILVSEWMGFYLLHESMISSVIVARDRFLKPENEGGRLLPDSAELWISVGSIPILWDKHIGWASREFHGLNIESIGARLEKHAVAVCPQGTVDVKNAGLVLSLNLWKIKEEELDLISEKTKIHLPNEIVHGFVLWFEVNFSQDKIRLCTGPEDDVTHWKQFISFFENPIPGLDLDIECEIVLKRQGRKYEITIQVIDIIS